MLDSVPQHGLQKDAVMYLSSELLYNNCLSGRPYANLFVNAKHRRAPHGTLSESNSAQRDESVTLEVSITLLLSNHQRRESGILQRAFPRSIDAFSLAGRPYSIPCTPQLQQGHTGLGRDHMPVRSGE